ncbi:MAG: PA2169 family four-helix-bundle protein [Myxococcota bacterium]
MALQTLTTMEHGAVEGLQEVIERSLDSAAGYQQAAEIMRGAPLGQLLRGLAEERAVQASELQEYVRLNHERPRDHESMRHTLRRRWLELRHLLGAADRHVLEEARRTDEALRHAYHRMLLRHPASPINDVLLHHLGRVNSETRDLDGVLDVL